MNQVEFCKTHRNLLNLMTKIEPLDLQGYLQALEGYMNIPDIDMTEERYQSMAPIAQSLFQFQQAVRDHIDGILVKGHDHVSVSAEEQQGHCDGCVCGQHSGGC